MSAPGMTSPIRAEAFENLQLNAGVFLVNFDHSLITDAEALKNAIKTAIFDPDKCLGVTRGGGSFNVTKERRNPDVDGARYAVKGGTFIDSADAYLSGTSLEVNDTNWARYLATADVDGTIVSKKKLTMRTAIDLDDYIDTLCWVGDLADGRLVMIELKNALNTNDFQFTFTDKGEGTVPFEFHAHQADVLDYDVAPFAVYFFEPTGEMASLTVSSAAGAAVGGTAITTNHTLTSGETFVYKTGNSAPTIGWKEHPDYTWTEWDGTSEIAVGAALNGKKITVATLDSTHAATMSGNATLVVKTA